MKDSIDGIALGKAYRDGITGFEGTCTGLCAYITGCNQALVVPRAKDGEAKEGKWFDTSRLTESELHPDVQLPSSAVAASAPGPDAPPSRSY